MINDERMSSQTLIDNFIDHYNDDIAFFYQELITLNCNTFLIGKIINFRFDLFTTRSQRLFFNLILHSLFESSLLFISRLVIDNEGDVKTILKFKNQILRNMKEEHKSDFQLKLKDCKFDSITNEILEKIKTRRNNIIAHNVNDITEENKRKMMVYFSDLLKIRDLLNNLFDTLSFDTKRLMLPIEYSDEVIHPVGTDSRPDVVRILDNIALQSKILTLAEDNRLLWEGRRKKLTDTDLMEINKYRNFLGFNELE